MIVGYARVSTEDQKLDLQKDALIKAGCEKIFEDHGFSGRNTNRPGFKEVIDFLQKGDVLVVWKLDRLGRGLKQLVNTIEDLGEKGIQFKSLTDNIDTTTASGSLIFGIMAVLAQHERTIIVERTNAGLAAAKRRGILLGRKKKIGAERHDVIKLYEDGKKTIPEIAHILKVSRQTVYNELKRRK